ncbi:peptidoglycan-binding protein [Streptomyces roseus]|uniref:peptidoglycan-binding domain-containing protein n=1 Tax=Streptomyces roseus TaxID=66430 RepID=UPI00380AAE62
MSAPSKRVPFRRTLATLTSVAALTMGLLGTSTTTAQAAMAACTDATVYTDAAGYYAKVPTVGYGGTNFCTLRRGADNNAVYELQQTLWHCYGYLVTDGNFGPATEALLKKAQTDSGVDPDGVYGPNTRDKMKHMFWRWEDSSWRCRRLTDAPQPLTQGPR